MAKKKKLLKKLKATKKTKSKATLQKIKSPLINTEEEKTAGIIEIDELELDTGTTDVLEEGMLEVDIDPFGDKYEE